MTPFNVLIHDKRIETGLSVREAAKKLRLPSLLLRRYEYGYYACSKKTVAKMCALYGIDEQTLSSTTFSYYGAVSSDAASDKNLLPVNIIMSVLLVVFVALTAVGGVFYSRAKTDPVSFYSDGYNSFLDALFEELNKDYDEFTSDETAPDMDFSDMDFSSDETASSTDTSSPTDETLSEDDDPLFSGDSPISEFFLDLVLKFALGRQTQSFETDGKVVKFKVGTNEKTTVSVDCSFDETAPDGSYYSVSFSQMMKKTLSLSITAFPDEGGMFLYSTDLFPDKGFDLSAYDNGDEYSAEDIAFAQERLDDALDELNKTIRDDLGQNYSAEQLLFDQYEGFLRYSNNFCAWFFCVLLAPIFALFVLYFLFKTNVIDKYADKFIVKETLPTEKGADLPLNCRYVPIFNERIIKILGLVLLLFASSVAFVDYSYSHNLSEFVSSLKNLPSFTAILKGALPVAVSLLFFVKIDISLRKRNLLQTTLLFFVLGLGYFYAIFLVAYTLNIKQFVPLLNLVRNYLPGNVFMGMTAIASIALFLFVTPRFCLKRKAYATVWRLSAVVPAFYLVFSNFVAPFITMPVYVNAFLYPKSLMPTLFCLSYIVAMYLYGNAIIKKYKSSSAAYIRGRRFFLIKNIVTVAIIAVLSLSDYLLGLAPSLKSLGFGKSYIMAIMIPFIAFYQPRIEKRNALEDACYGICYGAFFCSSYVAFIAYFLTVYKKLFFLALQMYVFLMNIFG